MRFGLAQDSLFVLFLLWTGLCSLAVVAEDGGLDKGSFEPEIKKHKKVLMLFEYRDSEVCRNLHPQFVRAQDYLREQKYETQLLRIECADHQDFCNDQGVSKYPTLRLYYGRRSTWTPYNGRRTAHGLVSYISHGELELPYEEGEAVDVLNHYEAGAGSATGSKGSKSKSAGSSSFSPMNYLTKTTAICIPMPSPIVMVAIAGVAWAGFVAAKKRLRTKQWGHSCKCGARSPV